MAYKSKYTGAEVDALLDVVSQGGTSGGGGSIKIDSTLSTTSTNAIQNKAVAQALNNKQDKISDLATIREGAQKGSTALQEEKYTGTYSKPSGGIPKSDLASAVQTSLGKADTALQSHQDISGKQDKLVSGTNIKTINGIPILGSGDITISGGGGGGIVSETDPIFSASPAASITDAKISAWDGKQDKITDLDTIRSGAEKGATALQSYTEQYKGTVTAVKINGEEKTPVNGVVDLGVVSGGSSGDLSNYATKEELSTKEDKPIVFDPAAANITVGNGDDIDGSFTAAQLQAATGMAPADFTAAILSGRKVCVSLSQGTTILLQMAYILDGSGIQLTFSDGVGSIIVVLQVGYSSGEGSINQGSVFNFFYTKDEVNYLIASAITSTLNTAV